MNDKVYENWGLSDEQAAQGFRHGWCVKKSQG